MSVILVVGYAYIATRLTSTAPVRAALAAAALPPPAAEGLAPDLDGFRSVQISELHAGPTMRRAYVQRVVDMTKELAPDLIALTGDIGSRGYKAVWMRR